MRTVKNQGKPSRNGLPNLAINRGIKMSTTQTEVLNNE